MPGQELVLRVSGVERSRRPSRGTPDGEGAKDQRHERHRRRTRRRGGHPARAATATPRPRAGRRGVARARVIHPAEHRRDHHDEEGQQAGAQPDEHVPGGPGQPRRRGRLLAVRVVGGAPTPQQLITVIAAQSPPSRPSSPGAHADRCESSATRSGRHTEKFSVCRPLTGVRKRYFCRPCMISRMRSAVSDGVLPTLTPAASRASFLAWAVPDEPDTMAPAWPIVLPSGAVKPAT